MRGFSRLGGVVAVLIAILVWIGWSIESDLLRSIHPGLATMKPVTAACLFLLGLAIIFYPGSPVISRRRLWAKAPAAGAFLLMLLIFLEQLGLFNLPFEEWFFSASLHRTGLVNPGRCSMATAIVLMMLAVAVLLRDIHVHSRFLPSEVLAVVSMICSSLGIFGYIYGVKFMYDFSSYSTMALHTALVSFILGVSVLFMRPNDGWMSVLNSRLLGGVVARRLLPAAILVPPVAGLIRTVGEMAGFYDDNLGLAFFVISEVLLFSIIVFISAKNLNQSDAQIHETTEAYKYAHEKLRQSEERLRLAVDAGGIATWHWDIPSDTVNWSTHCYDLFGLPHNSPLNTETTMSRIHPEDHDLLANAVTDAVANLSDFKLEYRARQPDGSYRWISSRGKVYTDKLGQASHMEGVMLDIDAQKRATETLAKMNAELEHRVAERTAELQRAKEIAEAADHSKSQFLTSMSHELRTPLNAIIGFTGTLIMGLPGPLTAEQRRQLEMVRGSARHQLSLINDLLDLAKIEAGRVHLTLEPLDCAAVAREVHATLAPMAEAKSLAFELELPEDGLMSKSDRRSLKQILINLVNNAIKFTEKGWVRLRLEQTGEQCRFLVEDSGAGITEDEEDRLFHAFGRLEKEGPHRQEGTGLGLHLSQKLASLLGGGITLESVPGQGSKFILTLPSLAPGEAT